jgi:hypothetical protein
MNKALLWVGGSVNTCDPYNRHAALRWNPLWAVQKHPGFRPLFETAKFFEFFGTSPCPESYGDKEQVNLEKR